MRDPYPEGAGAACPPPRPPKRQADAARWNTGELMLIVRGTARKTPPRPIAMLYAAILPGGVTVGSGNPETPCARIHIEVASIAAFVAAVA